jgi:hypothetical protein
MDSGSDGGGSGLRRGRRLPTRRRSDGGRHRHARQRRRGRLKNTAEKKRSDAMKKRNTEKCRHIFYIEKSFIFDENIAKARSRKL